MLLISRGTTIKAALVILNNEGSRNDPSATAKKILHRVLLRYLAVMKLKLLFIGFLI